MKRQLLLAAICALGLTGVTDADPAPATGPVAAQGAASKGVAEAMKINVVEVKGLVQVRMAEGQPWQKAVVGMVLDQGAEFRTGPRSSVTCQIPPDQTLVLDRLGTVKIDEAIRSGNKVKTDAVMKYGRTKYDIEAAGAEHETTIRSPGSTLAVRGTFVSLYDQPPFTPIAESFHGQAEFRAAHRELRFGGKTPTRLAADKGSVAETALAQSTIDPTSAHTRTKSEKQYIADQTSKSALFELNDFSGIPVIRNGPPPPTDAQLFASVPHLPGSLDIVMRWQGNANVNLEVGAIPGTNGLTIENKLATIANFPVPEYLYPGFGQNHSQGGGTIPYDNQGGPNGGMEIAYWKGNNYPRGLYFVTGLLASGGPALVTFDVFLNGKQMNNLETLEVNSQGHLVIIPTNVPGVPTAPVLVKNNQITRPLSLTKQPNADDKFNFGPDYFRARTVNLFIPATLENDIKPQAPPYDVFNPIQEPPVTFPSVTPGKPGKAITQASAKPASAKPVVLANSSAPIAQTPMETGGGARRTPKSR